MILTYLRSLFLDPAPLTVITPMPPHVANLRLDMRLLGLHMDAAAHAPDERTRAGYIQVMNKEYKS